MPEWYNWNAGLGQFPAWSIEKRIFLNMKTPLVHFGNEKHALKLGCSIISDCEVVKFLGIFVDRNFKFEQHVIVLRKWAVIRLLLCTFVHWWREVLYDVEIKPFMLYGLLIYKSTSANKLKPILLFQKNVMNLIFFSKRDFSRRQQYSRKTISRYFSILIH